MEEQKKIKVGCTIEIEHRYEIEEEVEHEGFLELYYGRQTPFNVPILFQIYEFTTVDFKTEMALSEKIVLGATQWVKLEHPKILRPVDILPKQNEEESFTLIVSQRGKGVSLRHLLSKIPPFSLTEAHGVFKDIVDALKYAHSKEIYHGNLSSDYIYLDGEAIDNASVTNWCVALDVNDLEKTGFLNPYQTRAYAPERLRNNTRNSTKGGMTAQADIFSLAIVLYEMLSGVHPFIDYNDDTIYDPVNLSTLLLQKDFAGVASLVDLGFEKKVADVVLKGLEKLPEDRWQSVEEFYDAFTEACNFEPKIKIQKTKVQPVQPTLVKTDDPNDHLEDQPLPDKLSFKRPEAFDASLYLTPSPKGRALAIAIVLLIFCNVVWFLYAFDKESVVGDYVTEDLVQIETEPPGASITEILPTGPHLLGETPIKINLKDHAQRQIQAKIAKSDYDDIKVTVASDGKDTTLVRVGLPKK